MAQEKPKARHVRKWRRYLVYPDFQLKLIAPLMAMNILFLGSVVVMEYAWPKDSPFFVIGMLLSGALVLVLTFFWILILSHRLAGPMVRMTRYFEEIAREGKITYLLAFRRKDYFSSLPEAINSAMQAVSKSPLKVPEESHDDVEY